MAEVWSWRGLSFFVRCDLGRATLYREQDGGDERPVSREEAAGEIVRAANYGLVHRLGASPMTRNEALGLIDDALAEARAEYAARFRP